MLKLSLATTVGVATFAWLLAAFDTKDPKSVAPAPSASAPVARPIGSTFEAIESPDAATEVTPELTTIEGDDGFRLLTFTFKTARAKVTAFDLGMTRELKTPLVTRDATLVVNGGFFDAKHEVMGVLVSDGRALSPKSDALGGGVFTIANGVASLQATETYAAPEDLVFAVQAKPRLVVDAKSNIGAGNEKNAERTALCSRDHGATLEVVLARGDKPGDGPSLALFADMLVSRGCEEALNLDGGPSTGAAWRSEGAILELAPRAPIRTGIAIVY